jgi:hypothetical protein
MTSSDDHDDDENIKRQKKENKRETKRTGHQPSVKIERFILTSEQLKRKHRKRKSNSNIRSEQMI